MADTQASAMERETVHAMKPTYNNNNVKRPQARNTNNASGPTTLGTAQPKSYATTK